MGFYVKEFSDESIAVVPNEWVDFHGANRKRCSYPSKSLSSSTLSKNKVLPKEDWNVYDFTILHECETYEIGVKKSRRFTGESQSTSTETPKMLGKGLRRKKSTSFFKSKDSTESSDTETSNSPSMPQAPVYNSINHSSVYANKLKKVTGTKSGVKGSKLPLSDSVIANILADSEELSSCLELAESSVDSVNKTQENMYEERSNEGFLPVNSLTKKNSRLNGTDEESSPKKNISDKANSRETSPRSSSNNLKSSNIGNKSSSKISNEETTAFRRYNF